MDIFLNSKLIIIVQCLFCFTKAENFCADHGNGHYVDPIDCSRYIVCSYGRTIISDCPNGLLFNTATSTCDFPYNVQDCVIEEQSNEEIVYSNNPRDLSPPVNQNNRPRGKEIKQEEEHQQQLMQHSVHMELPNPLQPNVLPAEHSTIDQPFVDCSVDGLFPLPDCSFYVQCASGMAFEKPCPPGTYFNAEGEHCGFDDSRCYGNKQVSETDFVDDHKEEDSDFKDDIGELRQGEGGDVITLMKRIKDYIPEALRDSSRSVRDLRSKEATAARRIKDSGASGFSGVSGFLGSTPLVKQMSIPAQQQLLILNMIQDKFHLDSAETNHIMGELDNILYPSITRVQPDMSLSHPVLNKCPYPKNSADNLCDAQAQFRTYDGSCNNLDKPMWGKSFRGFSRFLRPAYYKGIDAPRRSKSGKQLPSARYISVNLFEDQDRPSAIHTVLMIVFGQFLDHDLTRTAVTKLSTDKNGDGEMVEVKCGPSECETKGAENAACLPIFIPKNDPAYKNKECLMFVRTQEAMRDDCIVGPREQMNQVTSTLDASNIYGSTKEEAEKLRDLSKSDRGRLRMLKRSSRGYKSLLPKTENPDCRDLNNTIKCFDAGDSRVNENVALTAIHTVFARLHNQYEEALHQYNPHWTGERLYQTSRHIMAAVLQHITYNEFLPILLGTNALHRYGLQLGHSGYSNVYDRSISPDVTNVFGVAAFRYAHSQLQDVLYFSSNSYDSNEEEKLSKLLRRPVEIYHTSHRPGGSGVDSLLLGSMSHVAQKVDRFFTKELTTKLFAENPPHGLGMDLPAINIQRGREHGIPGYNDWREWCGLRRAKRFSDLEELPSEVRVKFSKLYKHVDDIDLYPAGVSERHMEGAVVGPTFGCLIARQFRNLKIGDRFWYEKNDPLTGFTLEQITEIRKITLSKIICQTTDNINLVQKYAMLQPISEAFKTIGKSNYQEAYSLASLYRGENNERRPCKELPSINLQLWQE